MNTSTFFDSYFKNAEVNSILIMDSAGTILNVNNSFTNNFGYSNEEIRGLNFSILFTEKDKEKNLPLNELKTVLAKGSAHDDNDVVHKNGVSMWATGESILVTGLNGEKYIVKDVINLQSKKQFELFLHEMEDLLERVFESSKEISIMILDGSMKILKVNEAFMNLFKLTETPKAGSRLSDIDHSFWSDSSIKQEIRNIIVKNEPLKNRDFSLETSSGKKMIRIDSRTINTEEGPGKKIFIIIREMT
jgi:PAS domain S-box-containing protein